MSQRDMIQTRMFHPTSGMISCKSDSRIRHEGIVCDICQKAPIVGIRYKCQQCDDFDLCSFCFQQNHHNYHNFSAYRRPI